MNTTSEVEKTVLPIVPEQAICAAEPLPHMMPADKAARIAPIGVKLPEDVAASFRGTPFADLYEEAINLLRSRNITTDELRYLSNALNTLVAKRSSEISLSPYFIRQARLSDVDGIEALVKYWAQQGENLPRKRVDIIRNIDSFAVCERDGQIAGCASLFVYDSGLAEIRSLGVSPNIQRQGQGRAIVEYLIERARRLDIDKVFVLTRNPGFFSRVGFKLTTIDALPEKILKDCENCPKRARCDELAYEYTWD